MLKNSEKVIIDGGMCVFVITSVSVSYGILAQMKCLRGHLKIIIKKMATVIIIFGCARDAYILNPSSRFLKKCKATPLENGFCTRLVREFCTRNDHFPKK